MTAPPDPVALTVEASERLSRRTVADVLALVQAVGDADGVPPLSEHVMLHLRHGGDHGDVSIVARLDGRVVGYGHLDTTDVVAGPSAEMAVAPGSRRMGVGRSLLVEMTRRDPHQRLRLWAHGRVSAAGALARSQGFTRERVLHQLRRSLHAPLPQLSWPDGVRVRTFVPGDEQAWLALNARAFADLPDQGRWDRTALEHRMAEPWFDPAGFFLAERDGRLVGFHWTKVHGADRHGHEPIGEVYVVGVDPDEQGRGLGRALTLTGLRHLRRLGLHEALLYVDADNGAALATYRGLGFSLWDTDVCYRREPGNGGGPTGRRDELAGGDKDAREQDDAQRDGAAQGSNL